VTTEDVTDPSLESIFRSETATLFDDVEARLLSVEQGCRELDRDWRAVLGALHTIKGNCGMVERDAAEAASHALEQAAREVRDRPIDTQRAGIDGLLASLDRLRATAFPDGGRPEPAPGAPPVEASTTTTERRELVDPQARLDDVLEASDDVASLLERIASVVRRDQRAAGRSRLGQELGALEHAAGRCVQLLRRAVMDLRLVPLRGLVARFVRPVRDLARGLGKQVEVRASVGELAIDRSVADRLAEPLVHLVRNAVAHGVEAPAERVRAGKPDVGVIEIAASTAAGRLELRVRDDGRGFDFDRLRATAEQRGLEVAALDRDALIALAFAPGVSTAPQATAIAGRGVGLDQTRRAVEAIGGSIQVTSEAGAGTEFRMRVPMALALQRALVVRRGELFYALPFAATLEVARWPRDAGGSVDGVGWRADRVPSVAPLDGVAVSPVGAMGVLVVRGDGVAALSVHQVLGYQDVTIRELDPIFGRPRGVTGAAILVDGQVALVLDPDALEPVAEPEAA
jgi:two-component system chemotaxis sensor kinase CheA